MTNTTSTTVADLVIELKRLRGDLAAEKAATERKQNSLSRSIADTKGAIQLATLGCEPEVVDLARSVVVMVGRPKESAEGAFEAALEAIAEGGSRLRSSYIGAKRYDRFHQRVDGPIGTVPAHGNIVFKVMLTDEARKRSAEPPLSLEERDAACRWLLAEQARDRSA